MRGRAAAAHTVVSSRSSAKSLFYVKWETETSTMCAAVPRRQQPSQQAIGRIAVLALLLPQ
jgi:hypothetical protein